MRNHRGYLMVKIAARYLILFSSYLKYSHTHEFFGRPLLLYKKKRFILDFRRFKIQKLPTFISLRIYFGFRISEKSKMNLPTYENSSVLYSKSRENPE